MLIDGVVIMAIGMGTVFIFLGIMVAMVEMIAFFMRSTPLNVSETTATGVLHSEVSSSEEIAVILAAVRDYTQGENS